MVPAAPSRAADLGEFTQLAERFRLSLEARNRAPATVTIYLDAVYRFRDFLSDQGMPLAVTAIRREHVESFIQSCSR